MLQLTFYNFQATAPTSPPIQGRFYRGEGEKVNLGVLDKVLELHKKMTALKSPAGSHDSPARSCQDLLIQNADIENGKAY